MVASGTSDAPRGAGTPRSIVLRAPDARDLDAINGVIERAVMDWDLPERVKRLALPLYRYNAYDFHVMQFRVADLPGEGIAGVAAWEEADARDLPDNASNERRGVILHGLYVDPASQREGFGSRLLEAATQAARDAGARWLLVKAQNGAEAFFERCGMARLPVRDTDRDYGGRYLLDLDPA